ncbi:molybdopterin-dependent oxidoreductase [Pinisolibacter aquiterrae]|uniref:molybdopterin-dependent oxidoreductase n=1 Tax=Pinisolibacter aquiterrae TaxID=2815579 RepID=UPI001C3C6265|nr:molybdopterin-dependent oxidoreductase [Pinisolibacter aquiterrae]MBV5264876.1 molybdopterin-dependent oxidoreductase [Pinisolibacter aquiterrae]MCC8234295.1 molybdopterin-dependent oxidoreductase [Pinisolibacter aquiterrae]
MITRSTFIRSLIPGAVSAALLPHLARAASGAGGVTDGRVLVNTSLGPMFLVKKGGQVVGIEQLKQDGAPWKLLGDMPDRLYNKARVKAPMVRRDFLAKRDKSNRADRGSRDFVEVSWDDALKLVADEMTRVKTKYGNASLHRGKSSWASNHAHFYRTEALLQRFLNGFGGSSTFFGNYSNQAVSEILPAVAWSSPGAASDWPVIHANAKLIVLWGANPLATTRILSGRYATKAWYEVKARGIEVIAIDPMKSETIKELGCEWVPIRPNTDVALALGLMHTLLTENLHDAKFIEDYTRGFKDFQPYLTGTEDGTPKTAEWASGITGVPAETIRGLARKMAKTRTTIASGWSTQRQHHGEQAPWAIVALGAMLGQIGLPGGGVSFGLHYADGGLPRAAMPVVGGTSPGSNPIPDPFPIACLSDAYLNPGKTIECKGRKITYPDIQLVYTSGGNQFTHHQDTNRVIEAFRKPETIIVQDPWWTPSARFADIVLPAASDLERNDLGQMLNLITASHAAVDPQFKSRTDYDILTELSDRLGYKQTYTEGRSEMDWVRFFYDAAKAQSKTVKMPDFDEFWAGEGIIEFPMGKGDFVHLADFREDPLLKPVSTASGLIEFVSPYVRKLGYDDCPAHPTWLEPVEWKGSKAAEKFPLQLVSPHPPFRLHSQMCNTKTRTTYTVADREPVVINADDAKARGIADGDIVRLFNDRGQVLAGAVVTPDILAGTICLHEGAWYDPAEPGKQGALDKYGSPNLLTLDVPLTSRFAQATIAGTAICDVEKWKGEALPVTAFDAVG